MPGNGIKCQSNKKEKLNKMEKLREQKFPSAIMKGLENIFLTKQGYAINWGVTALAVTLAFTFVFVFTYAFVFVSVFAIALVETCSEKLNAHVPKGQTLGVCIFTTTIEKQSQK